MNRDFENIYMDDQINLIAGIDEAGRGPLAGPVVAAAVIFQNGILIDGVDDSKKLSPKMREKLFYQIMESALSIGIGIVSNEEIDKMNILNATLHAMQNSVTQLRVKPDLVLVDGNRAFNYEGDIKAIVKGDTKSFSIACASIIAKVYRDKIMERLSREFPDYFWDSNKGYATQQHIDAIKMYGASKYHRQTFLGRILNRKD